QFATAKLPVFRVQSRETGPLPRGIQRVHLFWAANEAGRPMDAETRRRQLVAAINRVAGGDRAALRLVYSETSAKLFGVCLRILGDRSEAEDVLQDVYLTLWRKAESFDEAVASPITWLVAIARNRSIDRLRSSAGSRAHAPLESAAEIPDEGLSALERLENGEGQARVKDCLPGLEERPAAGIRSAFLDGFTYAEL